MTEIDNSVYKLLADPEASEVCSYLLYTINGQQVYYSTNQLMKLCAVSSAKVYRVLNAIDASPLQLETKKVKTAEVPKSVIQNTDQTDTKLNQLFASELATDQDETVSDQDKSERKRSLYTIQPGTVIELKLPIHSSVDHAGTEVLDFGDVALDDIDFQRTVNALSYKSILGFVYVSLSVQAGYADTNNRYLTLQEYRRHALSMNILPNTPISLKELRDTGLFDVVYTKSNAKFRVKYSHIRFRPQPSLSSQPNTISDHNYYIAIDN